MSRLRVITQALPGLVRRKPKPRNDALLGLSRVAVRLQQSNAAVIFARMLREPRIEPRSPNENDERQYRQQRQCHYACGFAIISWSPPRTGVTVGDKDR